MFRGRERRRYDVFLKENILLAIDGLRSNKMRSFLTMLGIIIGIGAVIAIVSIGDALTASLNSTLSRLGTSNIYVYVSARDSDSSFGPSGKMDDADLISEEQIQTFAAKYAGEIGAVSYSETGENGKAQDGHRSANITMEGTNAGYGPVNNVKLTRGRFLNDRDVRDSRRVAVVSDRLVSNLFRTGEDPVGREIDVDTDSGAESYTVVGVYKYDPISVQGMEADKGKDTRTSLYVPVGLVKATAENQNYMQFVLSTKGVQDTQAFTDKVQRYFERLYAANGTYTCKTQSMESAITEWNQQLSVVSTAIAAIAAIALLVGGIGVMNIMLVSVTERTREIGTRKALGARSGYIRTQFIVEAVIICMIGGVLGVVLGLLLAWGGVSLMERQMPVPVPLVVSAPVILGSVGFSMLIGVFFGYYPARKASRLNPIDALRYE
jgi:putative ABC transport system permease protein